MAEQEYVVIYAATYPTVAAARAVLDTIEHPHEKVAGTYDAAVVDKENGKAHVVKRMDHPHVRIIPEWFGGGALTRKELDDAAEELLAGEAGLIVIGEATTAGTERAFLAAYRRVRYCFHAIVSVADPSALPKNRRLTAGELNARIKPMTPDQATAARDRLEALVNALLEASISVLTEAERAAFDGGTALDATAVPLFSRGPSRRAGLSASDPDGGWYVREGDHREREDDKGKPLRTIAWALEATIAATARPPHAEPGCPNLATGLALTRPGQDPGGTGARVLASAAARGHKPGWLGYDRACTQALPGRFHLPARALGYRPVMDYRDDQPGIQASTGGALLVEGTWYCPALPEPLITATTRLRRHAITRELYDQQITARACYQLKHKDGPGTDGTSG